jgi:hypothetical protein
MADSDRGWFISNGCSNAGAKNLVVSSEDASNNVYVRCIFFVHAVSVPTPYIL